MAKQVNILGIDLSLNHSGFVLMDAMTLEPLRAFFVTTKAGAIKAAEGQKHVKGYRLPAHFEHTDWNGKNYMRLLWWFHFLEQLRQFELFGCRYVAIEDYAMHAKTGSTTQIAELGGIVRLAFRDCRMRYHEPTTVKIFVTGAGNAEPSETELMVRKRWAVDYRKVNGSRSGQRPSEDLATAYALARMVAVEWKMRKGLLSMSELEECEVRVFNRVTKTNPINILGRDWIADPYRSRKSGASKWPEFAR